MEIAALFVVLGAGLAIGLGAIGSAIGEGYIAMNAMKALERQPGASQKILRLMIIGQAITETTASFAFLATMPSPIPGPIAPNPIANAPPKTANIFNTVSSGFNVTRINDTVSANMVDVCVTAWPIII